MKYFYINNTKINYVPNNRSIIEYCENLGIDIPHYCYHPKLSIAGNCRMCLVEVKGSPKPVISCAMSLLNKMEIYTDSPLVKKSREGVLEFLLLNHPLDCPVCDQGGECDLQDQSFVFGINKKRFYNYKRIVIDKNIGPIVKTVMTRCIHCTRCVRFSTEIAGTEQLGMYGRGVSSEIGTYVTKMFNSELSGNIIDICPVGALTSKQYPFLGRIWELKNIKSIDYSDGSSTNIQLYLKSNSLVKILPGYNERDKTNNWISDKTRFSFDGMFSPERISDIFISEGKINKKKNWSDIFNEIIYILYFQNHLSKHTFDNFKLIIVFNSNIDIETLTLLMFLSKKYPFVDLRKTDSNSINNNLAYKFQTNFINKSNNLINSDLCFLININTRYENPELNIKLRQRFLKGNFNVFSLNSLIDLTYPVSNLGSNLSSLQQIVEGNHRFCQDLSFSNNPTVIISSDIYNRYDSNNIVDLICYLKNFTTVSNKHWNGINLISNSLNEVGVNFLNKFKIICLRDILEFSSIFFIDNDFSTPTIKKLIELKLLYFNNKQSNKMIIELHNIFKGKFINSLKKNFNSNVYINLPNKVFFEESIIIQDSTGVFKKTVKVLNSTNKSKSNWQVIRKLKSSLDNIKFHNVNLVYDFSKLKQLKSFIGYQYLPINSISSDCMFYKTDTSIHDNIYLKKSKLKIFNTKTKFWLDDFYIGGKDLYSKFSTVMIECSKSFRSETDNFNYIN